MEYAKYSAKTVNEAVTQACLRLGVTSDRLEYEVVQEPTSGFLGIGSKPAVIRARVRAEEAKPEAKSSVSSAPAEEKQPVTSAPEKTELKKEEKTEKNAVTNEETPENGGSFVSAEEIEKRAAAAAAREKAEGRRPERKPSDHRERETERHGDRRRYDRHDSRRGGRSSRPYRENRLPIVTTTAPHEPSQPKPERVVRELSEEELQGIAVHREPDKSGLI